MKKDEAQKIVNDFYKKHRSLKNNGHKIIVIDYPQDYNEKLKGQNIKGIHRAANNDTYIIASEHENKEELLKTIKHETYGHYGLNTFPQENKIGILLSVVSLQDSALKDEWQQVRYDYPDMKEFRQAEEVFCSVVSEVIITPEFQHSFNETLESKKEIQDVGKYIKMTLQTGDAKQLIVPENNDLQFRKYIETLKEDIKTLEHSTLGCIQKINEMKVEDGVNNKNIEKLEGVVKDIILESTKKTTQFINTLEALHHSDTKETKEAITPKTDIRSTEANSKDLYKHKKDTESDNYEHRYR